ncbi:MAG: succinylglutamate-semialdehyde dehydrogenase [Candidatus Didemnitutus sp.]|nr:succinylglutamate-semialdehyde dehydrogenase [Candidatus Didemnitutus sp.]
MNKFSSLNPSTGEMVWTGASATPAEIDAAIVIARAAQSSWAARPLEERAAVLRAFAQQLAGHKTALAEIISHEIGKPRWEALTEVGAMIGKIEISIAAHAQRCGEFSSSIGITRFKPHGVVAVLGPFNFPGHLPNGHIAPALLAGNSVVFKPSELAPAVAENVAECWKAAGLPAGVLNIVQGGRDVGARLAAHPGLNALFFTGSARAGSALSELFAATPERLLALEMGGNNPLVVHRAADARAAVALTIQSAYLTAGQRCTCARRLIVPTGADGDTFLNTLVAAIAQIRVGAPTDEPEPFMGPVISAAAATGLLSAQQKLIAKGATPLVLAQALRPGTGLLSPGLIEVTALTERTDEEFFGPLLQVIRVPDFAAAIREANHTAFGLAAGLISDDAALYAEFRRDVRAGIINWNQQLTGASSAAPFGGVGRSGNHRPSAFFAADYCSYPVASIEVPQLKMPEQLPPGLHVP